MIKIILNGIPIPQARMRHFTIRGMSRVFDPNQRQKESIKKQLLPYKTDAAGSFPRISFLFFMPIPQSIPKKHLDLFKSETLRHDKKPDIDNLVKLYLDCMDGIVLDGDQKVSLGPCIKIYSPNPRTEIWVESMGNIVTSREVKCIAPDVTLSDKPSSSESVYSDDLYIPMNLENPQSFDKITPHHII